MAKGILVAPDGTTLGLRSQPDRRLGDRRTTDRGPRDRRRQVRRRAKLRSLFFTAATFAYPQPFRHTLAVVPHPVVTTTIVSAIALLPSRAYDSFIQEAAALHGLDTALIRSVIETESAFDPTAISSAGAIGLMQLMPDVAAELGVEDPLDPRENILGGTLYLRRLLDAHRGNLELTLASYNAGPGAVARYGAVPPFPETQRYVKRVIRRLARHSGADD